MAGKTKDEHSCGCSCGDDHCADHKAKGKITKDMSIIEIAHKYPMALSVFEKYGMHCIGCVAAQFETLEQGCEAHGIDADKLVADMNKLVEKEKKKKD